MELYLVKITDKTKNKASYHAVNDKHYDAMLAGGGTTLDYLYPWEWLGMVEISEEVLKEQGYS